MISVRYHVTLNEVQEDPALVAALEAPLAQGPFDRLGWLRALVEEDALSPLLAVAQEGEALAVLPMAQTADGLGPLANWYAFTVRPLGNAPRLLPAIARDLKRRAARLTLWPLPDEQGEASALSAAFRAAGWFTMLEPCDTNHYLTLGGRSYADYLASRPGPLRTTLKRKGKKVAVTLYDQFNAAAWADYEAVYAQSWKPEEGSPTLLRRFAREEGAAGRLRLGLAHADIDGTRQPVAAQLWTVENGTAYIHKLAYAEAAKPLSPGTTLSAALFERVIDTDRVHTVDFGTGDDPYKRDWMEAQRPRYRLTAHRLTAPGEWPAIAKALLKRALRRG